jgi:hypothetical protein
MIPSEHAEQYVVNLPEETKLNEILTAYQIWQDAVKKLFQVLFHPAWENNIYRRLVH